MGSFTRTGTFKDKANFVAALKVKLAKLQEGPLRGASLETEGDEKATLKLMGAKVAFTVGAGEWTMNADLPVWIPIPQKSIEEKFDKEFADLKGL